jgi:hypothetical protein
LFQDVAYAVHNLYIIAGKLRAYYFPPARVKREQELEFVPQPFAQMWRDSWKKGAEVEVIELPPD